MKNILLTGSGGFIGSHLKNTLNGKYTLFTPRSRELNLLDKNAVEAYIDTNKIDFIIHSAASGVRITPDAKMEEVAVPNLQMFNNLADFVEDTRPMVVFGSGAEYDKSRSLINVKEEDFGKFIPRDPYGYSKYMISREIEKRENILNLRIFGIYGMGEDPSRVTSCIVQAKLRNEPVTLNQNVRFHFIWIEDFCKIVDYFISAPAKEKFINVTPTQSIEIIELAKLLNVDIILKKGGLNKEYTGSNTKLLNIIKDFKFTSYENGMKSLYSQMLEMV